MTPFDANFDKLTLVLWSVWTPAAVLYTDHLVAQSSCLCNIWRHAGGQIHKPWEKAVLFPYKAAIHPLPCSSPAPRLGVGGYLQRAPRPAWHSLLGARLVSRTAVHLGSDGGKRVSFGYALRRTDEVFCLNFCAESSTADVTTLVLVR